jgi:hypothetical protein
MRALRERPTALERWTSGVREGMKLATGPQDRNADAFYQKRVPKGAPDYLETATITFPSGRTADEICPTEIAVPVWCAHMGTLTFHPWPVRRDDVDHPDELRIDLDPQPGTTFGDAVRVAGVARELLADLGMTGYAKTSGNRGIHVYVRIEPRWEFADVRHAGALDVVTADAELGRRLTDLDVAGEAVDADREQRRADRRREDLGRGAPVVLGRGVDDELALLVQQRAEERQSLDVVPVEVAQQARATERRTGRAAQSEVAQPGAEVEQEWVLAGHVDGHAGRVAAVTGDLITMARGRPPDAMKPDQHAARRPPQERVTENRTSAPPDV